MSAHRTVLNHGVAVRECCQKCAAKHAVKAALYGSEAVNPTAYQKAARGRKTRVFSRNRWGQKVGIPHPSGVGVMPGSARTWNCCPGDGKTGCIDCGVGTVCTCVDTVHPTHGDYIRCSCTPTK